MNDLTHIDIYSGLGGFALAARANGIRTTCFCEIDPRCRAFLSKAWPGIPQYDDVRQFKAREWGGAFLLTAGTPCQPASRAGKQGGAEDDRWLWDETIRVLDESRPAWALLENPLGILDVGIDGILSDVERCGYEMQPVIIPACAVNSPQRRDRVWIICRNMANTASGQRRTGTEETGNNPQTEATGNNIDRSMQNVGVGLANTDQQRRQGADAEPGANGLRTEHRKGDVAHTKSRGLGTDRSTPGNAGHPDQRDESSMGNPEIGTGRTGQGQEEAGGERWRRSCDAGNGDSPWSRYVWLPCADGKLRRAPDDSFRLVDGLHRSVLAALGNSIVWQVAAEIIRSIKQADEAHVAGKDAG